MPTRNPAKEAYTLALGELKSNNLMCWQLARESMGLNYAKLNVLLKASASFQWPFWKLNVYVFFQTALP